MNKSSLIAYADANLDSRSVIPTTLYVPPYYKNPTASEEAKQASAQDTYNVAVFARAYLYTKDTKYLVAMADILNDWENHCTSVSHLDDTALVACYHWYKVFEAASLIGGSSGITILDFARDRLLPAIQSIGSNFNNWQSWSILAEAKLLQMEREIGVVQSVDAVSLSTQLKRHLAHSTWNLPLIGGKGEFWTENVRGNSSLYYTLFSLAPLMLADEILKTGTDWTPYVNAFAANCLNPGQYYAQFGTDSLIGKVTKLLGSSSAMPILPDPDSWSGRFFFYLASTGRPQPRSLYNQQGTFSIGIGDELLYFVENDKELGVL